MLVRGPRQRHVWRRPPARAALTITVAVVLCAGLAGGQAQAAGPGSSSVGPRTGNCVGPNAGTITISPYLIGQAQLPVTFTTSDQYFPPSGGNYDVYTIDCSPVSIGTTTAGGANYVTFTGSSRACGQHVFDDKYYAGGSTPDQEFAGTYTVSCVSANPSTILSTQQPVPVTVTGSTFFSDYNSFTVDIDGMPVNTTPTFNGNTFTTVITAQGLSCATHTITVSEKMGGSIPTTATTPLVVQCPHGGGNPPPPPGNPPPHSPGAPKLTVNPAVVADGTLTHVTGIGFNPSTPVILTWQSPAGAVLYACSANALTAPRPAADASGKIDVYCLALPHQAIGAEQIVADQTANSPLPARHVAAPVLVEDGSMQPSDGNQLIFRR